MLFLSKYLQQWVCFRNSMGLILTLAPVSIKELTTNMCFILCWYELGSWNQCKELDSREQIFSSGCTILFWGKRKLFVSAGGDVSVLSGNSSPRVTRSSRPLSTVFQNIHPPNIWRHRKGTASFTQVSLLKKILEKRLSRVFSWRVTLLLMCRWPYRRKAPSAARYSGARRAKRTGRGCGSF